MDKGYIGLRDAIIKQTVEDYCGEVRTLARMYDKEKEIERIKANRLTWKPPVHINDEEAEEIRKTNIFLLKCRLEKIEKFFHTKWYRTLCDVDANYMIPKMKAKAIEELCKKAGLRLKSITKKNMKSKTSKASIEWYRMVKRFLESEYLVEFVDKPSDYYIDMIWNVVENQEGWIGLRALL